MIEVSDADLKKPAVIPGGHDDGSVFRTLLHIVDVERSWLARWIAGAVADGDDSDLQDTAAVLAAWESVEQERNGFLAGLTENDPALNRRERNLSEAILHVFNHTTHHRAELCVGLTALGHSPPALDVMDYVRSGAPPAEGS